MQIIAMLTMMIDHIGMMLLPESEALRIIGRVAFPLYAFGIVQGYIHTRSRQKYMTRLLALAGVSQLPFMFGLQLMEINVVGTFALCLGILAIVDRLKSKLAILGIVAAALYLMEILPFNYGAYALLLILIYRYMLKTSWTWAHMVINIAFAFMHGWQLQIFSIIPTLFLANSKQLAGIGKSLHVPRWLWRGFYPGHLIVIAMIVGVKHIIEGGSA